MIRCPDGKVVVGGGFQAAPLDVVVSSSRPLNSNIWTVKATHTEDFRITIFAICAMEE